MQSIFARRVGAFTLDVAILFAFLTPLGFFVQRAVGLNPSTSHAVYGALVLNFSFPVWTYFALADRSRSGATIGKRALSLRTAAADGGRIGIGCSLMRTAVKMLPWEMAHASLFLFAPVIGEFAIRNWVGLGASYTLSFAYLLVAWRTGGRRSVHDLVASTVVVRIGRQPPVTAE